MSTGFYRHGVPGVVKEVEEASEYADQAGAASAQALVSRNESKSFRDEAEGFASTALAAGRVRFFDSVAEMASATFLQVGDSVRTLGYSSPGDGGGWDYEVVAAGTGTHDGGAFIDLPGVQPSALQAKAHRNQGFSFIHYGADPAGATDSTSAINAFIDFLRGEVADVGNAVIDEALPVEAVFSPGIYSVSSVNLSDIRGPRNLQVRAFGCTFVGNTAGVAVVDAVATRWLWLWGLTVMGTNDNTPKHGLQIGPKGAEACGNNKFFGVQCLGDYTLSPMANYGSETTQWYSCRFSTESLLAGTYAAYCDGQGLALPSSLYATVTRSLGTPVSFTNNAFYGCQFRHLGDDGYSLHVARTEGWLFDESCYFLCYSNANVHAWQAENSRNGNLTLGGLFETSHTNPPAGNPTSGVQNTVLFFGNGTNSQLIGLRMIFRNPHAEQHVLAFSNLGSFDLPMLKLSVGGNATSPGATLFGPPTSTLTASGEIEVANGDMLNLDALDSFSGVIQVDDYTKGMLPVAGAFDLFSSDQGLKISAGIRSEGYDSWRVASEAAGVLTCEGRLNSVSVGSATNITDIDEAGRPGLVEVVIRRNGGSNVTFVHNSSKIRNIGAADITLGNYESITYAKVAAGVWQQVGGKF